VKCGIGAGCGGKKGAPGIPLGRTDVPIRAIPAVSRPCHACSRVSHRWQRVCRTWTLMQASFFPEGSKTRTRQLSWDQGALMTAALTQTPNGQPCTHALRTSHPLLVDREWGRFSIIGPNRWEPTSLRVVDQKERGGRVWQWITSSAKESSPSGCARIGTRWLESRADWLPVIGTTRCKTR